MPSSYRGGQTMAGQSVTNGTACITVVSSGAGEERSNRGARPAVPLTGLLVAVIFITLLGGPVWAANCPCRVDPFFTSFINGQQQLIACTDNTPLNNFVRLVAANIDLVVLFESPP